MREQLGAYALGQLTGEQWQQVQGHLASCPACRADLDEIAPAASMLAAHRHRLRSDQIDEPIRELGPPLPPVLHEQLRRTADADAGERSRRAQRQRWVLAAAAALLVVVGGGSYVAGSAAGRAMPTGVPVASRAVDQQVQASTSLVAHTWGLEIKLAGSGFAAGQVFRATVTDDSGRTVGAGEFVGTGANEMRCNLNSSVLRDDASSFQVSDAAGRVVLDASL